MRILTVQEVRKLAGLENILMTEKTWALSSHGQSDSRLLWEIAFTHLSSVRLLVRMISYNGGLREAMMRSRTTKTYRVFKKPIPSTKTC